MDKLIKFFKKEDGAVVVEYGILLALVAAVIIALIVSSDKDAYRMYLK